MQKIKEIVGKDDDKKQTNIISKVQYEITEQTIYWFIEKWVNFLNIYYLENEK